MPPIQLQPLPTGVDVNDEDFLEALFYMKALREKELAVTRRKAEKAYITKPLTQAEQDYQLTFDKNFGARIEAKLQNERGVALAIRSIKNAMEVDAYMEKRLAEYHKVQEIGRAHV